MRACLLLAAALPLAAQVKITEAAGRLDVSIDGKPFTTFYTGTEAPKPYLHPLRAASGKIVTRGYPMETVDGESKDHPHHRGLWFTHGDVNGFDFWANEPSQASAKKGKVALKKMGKVSSGSKSGSIAATFDWLDPQGKPLLAESRVMVFPSDARLRIVDLDITLTAQETVKFGDTKEGTFAIRLAGGLEEPERRSLPSPPRTGRMVDAEGRSGEKSVWGKRSPWVDYAGELDGEKLGVAIFDHPSNPKHPTYWHSRSYGLFAANIFGEHDFYADKTRDGGVTLEKGKSLRFRYRVVIHPGDAAGAAIGALYRAWAGQS
ncbi:MAG: PmoA family protein [Bryobacteraceae bacterium]